MMNTHEFATEIKLIDESCSFVELLVIKGCVCFMVKVPKKRQCQVKGKKLYNFKKSIGAFLEHFSSTISIFQ